MQRSESGQEGDNSFVRFTWLMSIDQAGSYALNELLPVVAHRQDSPTPISVHIEQPLTVIATAPLPMIQHLGLAAGGLCLIGAAAGGTVYLRHRRSARARVRSERETRAQQAMELHKRFQAARKQRVDGDLAAYMEALHAIASACEPGTPALDELAALHDRIAYAHYDAGAPELDRAESLVRRHLDALNA